VNHNYLKGPIEGWEGVKNGVWGIGDEMVGFKEWLEDIERKWSEWLEDIERKWSEWLEDIERKWSEWLDEKEEED
jgi:hypothetical protein